MKLRNKAQSALATAGYSIHPDSAIAQLINFAAQNSGIEFVNYNDRKAFASECRTIAKDWIRVKLALNAAARDGVKDGHVIAEAPHAFSGRLEWWTPTEVDAAEGKKAHWVYCVGEYFHTEYRKAAATLLEYAARRVRQNRPPVKR